MHHHVACPDRFELIVVDSLASTVMGVIVFFCSAALASVPWFVMTAGREELSNEYVGYTGALCAVAFVLAAFILGSFAAIITSAATALFVLFVVDRDAEMSGGSSYIGQKSAVNHPAHVVVVHGTFLETHPPKTTEAGETSSSA
jgi:hypothetical protein